MAIGGDGSATANAHIDHLELGLMTASTLSIQGIALRVLVTGTYMCFKEEIGTLCIFYLSRFFPQYQTRQVVSSFMQ